MTRRYTDREVSLIFQRATAEPDGPAGESGLTLADIKSIAAELGIDATRIDVAAASLAAPRAARANRYVGIPTSVQFETTIPAADGGAPPAHEIVALVRNAMGRQGLVEQYDDALEWKARDALGGRYVTVTPTRAGTRVSVLGNFRDGILTAGAMAGTAAFVLASVTLASIGLGPAATLLGSFAAAALPTPFVYRWLRRKEDAALADLHARLVGFLRSSARDEPGREKALAAGGDSASGEGGPAADDLRARLLPGSEQPSR